MINYESVYNNPDYIKISNKAISRFRKIIPFEELEQCRCIGMWNACKTFNNKSKLSTYLYNKVVWECFKYNKSNNLQQVSYTEKFYVTPKILSEISLVLNEYEYSLIHDKYIMGYTYNEIAKKLNIHKSKVQRQIRGILNKLRRILS